MITEQWFKDAVNYKQPIDLFLLIGHNPIRRSGSTIPAVYQAIRQARPNVPIQVFGGHTHIRDFTVYDSGGTGLESGRYCETLGFLSMSGIKSNSYNGAKNPKGVSNPTQAPKPVNGTLAPNTTSNATAFANLTYFRRYLDWNRLTFAYHAVGSQSKTFDMAKGKTITNDIYSLRQQLNLTALYGCAPQTWCLSCQPFGAPGNIYTILSTALSATVVNSSRADTPRLIILNTGSVRFDLIEGPFTYDDSFIVNPFHDTFQFIPDVPYAQARTVLPTLNRGAYQKRDAEPQLEVRSFAWTQGESCVESAANISEHTILRRDAPVTRGKFRRQTSQLTPGYVTTGTYPQNSVAPHDGRAPLTIPR